MKVSIILVGYSEIIDDKKYIYEINYDDESIFNFEIFKNKFLKYGIISDDELNTCMVISNSKNLKKESIMDDASNMQSIKSNYKIYIYCLNQDIKNKLIAIFKCYGEKLLYNLEACESEECLSFKNETVIDYKPNFELFNNDDFINLIRIYKIKPDIFKEFYKFISSEGLEKQSDVKCIDLYPLVPCIEKFLDNNLECIKKYKFNITDDYIRESLQKNNNNLGLTLKYILSHDFVKYVVNDV